MFRRVAFPVAAALALPGAAFAQAAPQAPETPPAADAAPEAPAQATPVMGSMIGALGVYFMTRDASGTSWQPDASKHDGIHWADGRWSFMAHALLNGVYDSQGGPRGDDKGFASGMVMLMARRDFANKDNLNFRVMLSPDPFMGKSGYPLLLAAGETADGKTPLVDRQHPHDLVMELSATYTHRLADKDSVYVYAGLPGEPAFGPPALMHRLSVMDSPEAPITHHWLDSTHITFGVVTAGWVHDNWKLEASAYKGREPDQNRFDIEAPKLDSAAVRLSWNPTPHWSLQVSWADQKSPEQLEPDQNETRWSASAIYTVPFGEGGWWSTTAAWGRRQSTESQGADGPALDGFALESALKPNEAWTLFARAEQVSTDELSASIAAPLASHGPVERVAKMSFGAIHDWEAADHVKVGLGALYAFNFIPSALKAAYGDDPTGAMVFLRLKID